MGSAVSAGSAVKALAKAKREGDTLKMVEAALSVATVAVTVAVVVREMREGENGSADFELEDK
ncbi:hypothetical protein [Phytoactinopolyspora halophila]|uniref:hypothetical protein n=1 Tax=Phytoactinopolyspora halophila TaxID=1981511 RepID=UPI000F4D4B9E|nr:hypothetical protein [Phytoactinopolyspora halophila]